MAEPLYYAEGGKVCKRPVEKGHENGMRVIELGFPVCIMHEAVGDGAAEAVAALMNAGDDADRKAAEARAAAIEEAAPLRAAVAEFLSAEAAVDEEADRARDNPQGWSSAPVMRRARAIEQLRALAAAPEAETITEGQIKYMVDRFLRWKLPENFRPDAGISFKATFNEHTAYPMKHEPCGTNLFDATQAEAMVRYMVEGMPAAPEAEERGDA